MLRGDGRFIRGLDQSARWTYAIFTRHLAYFVALAREGHFARAAERAHISQPALSAALRKLEADLGVRLVARGRNFEKLTAEGEQVLGWAQRILADYDGMIQDLQGLRGGLKGTLHIGVVPAAMPAVSFLTARFAAQHPAAIVDVESTTSRAIQRQIGLLEFDAGLTYLENEPLVGMRRMPLYHERYVFVARRGGRHADRQSIGWREALSERLCMLGETMQNRRILDAIAATHGLTIAPAVVSNSFLCICAHLRQPGWYSIVPHTFFQIFSGDDLVMIELEGTVGTQSIGLVLSDRDPLSPMAAALLRAIEGVDFNRELALASLSGGEHPAV